MDEQAKLQRKTIRLVLEQCQRTLELLQSADAIQNRVDSSEDDGESRASDDQEEADTQLRELVKSKVESADFLEKLGSMHMSVSNNSVVDCASWDMISSKDTWEDKNFEDQEGYVLVNQEDIVEAIASFMAAYLLSLKETKDLPPNKLQEALSKTFSKKGKKGKLRKAWDGSIVVYNVASWSATAIGMYHNPAIFSAASAAILSTCRVISKLF